MQKITHEIKRIRTSNKPGLMAHIVAGYPNLKMSENIALALVRGGANFLEIQIPFSDPVADGPLLARANEIALKNGMRVTQVFQLAKKISQQVTIPLFLMGYFNVVFKFGIEKFCQQAKDAGVSGFIFPDAPFDEAQQEGFLAACKKFDLAPIQVVSELTPISRLAQIGKISQGLIYCISRLGTTGIGLQFSQNLQKFLQRVRKFSDLPLAVGFGIATKKDVATATQGSAEIAIVGSAIMKIVLDERLSEKKRLEKIEDFFRELV
jgi:tryptophan synthase alpha chain